MARRENGYAKRICSLRPFEGRPEGNRVKPK